MGSRDGIEVDALYGCHLWLGRKDRDGYGRTSDGRLAHRARYEERHGSIEPGLELEHKCRRRACVRLDHLELFTRSQQERAKRWPARVRAKACRAGQAMQCGGCVIDQFWLAMRDVGLMRADGAPIKPLGDVSWEAVADRVGAALRSRGVDVVRVGSIGWENNGFLIRYWSIRVPVEECA